MDDDTRLKARERAPGEGGVWFEPKRYGYGAGLPVNLAGWIALGVYAGVMIGMALAAGPLAQAEPLLILAPIGVMVGVTVWFAILCARHTRGGWRWRWGGED